MLPILATPKYDMIVPSTGEAITYRPYVVKEEKILLIAMESNDENQIEQAVIDVIQLCVESPINIDDLTTFDVEFIFVTLRSKSVGEGIKLAPKCEHCEEVNEVKINLEEVKVTNLENKIDKHIKLTDDISIDLKWHTMKDRQKELRNDSETQTVINMIVASLETIYSGEETHVVKNATDKEVREFVESLNTDQFNEIVEVLANVPYLSYDMDYDCEKCGKENSISLNGLTDFF
jgi:phage FluMu protein Com